MAHKKLVFLAALVAVSMSAVSGGGAFARGLEGGTTGMNDSQKQAVNERKAEIKQRIEAKKAEVSTKLADKRLAACEKRQAKVNTIFTKATERNKKQLAVFQKIEERVKEFYVSKNLTSEGYDAAVANADTMEAAAVAAIEVSSEATFECATTDATKPGAAIKEAMQVRHAALKDYRTAVKDLILVVKKQHGQQQSGTSEAETDDASRNDTETTETEGVQ